MFKRETKYLLESIREFKVKKYICNFEQCLNGSIIYINNSIGCVAESWSSKIRWILFIWWLIDKIK